MKKILTLSFLFTFASLSFAQVTSIPRLEKQGDAIKLIVDNKPFLILGGELHNSSTSGVSYMNPIWEKMRRKNLNTVIAPVYWELLEPEEGKFNMEAILHYQKVAQNYFLQVHLPSQLGSKVFALCFFFSSLFAMQLSTSWKSNLSDIFD